MIQVIDEKEKERIFQFINENDLDYDIVDNGIIKPHLIAYDGQRFFFHKNESQYVVVKYDKNKDKPGISGAYQYYTMQSIIQIMEQLKIYDDSLPKTYFYPDINSIDFPLHKESYKEDWHEWIEKNECYSIQENQHCTYLSYTNYDYQPEMKSPFNTIGEDSWGGILHKSSYSKLEKLYFEIYPLCGLHKKESYMLKLLCGGESPFEEYITYKVYKKKGLKLLIENIFSEVSKFKK